MKNSIIFNISIVFIISILSVAFGFYFFIKEDKIKYYEVLKMKYFEVGHTLRENIFITINGAGLDKLIKPYGLKEIKDFENILKEASIIKDDKKNHRPPPPFMKKPFDKRREKNSLHHQRGFRDIEILEYQKELYIYIDTHFKELVFKELNFKPYNNNLKLLFFLFIELIFILSYIFTVKKLLPLKKLKQNIEEFGEGNFSVSFKIDSNDEIAEVANALQNSVNKIDKLINSRQLFLRNIMHELKTPITKGKVAIEFLEANRTKERLLNVFNRMEILIKESAMIEEITSGQNRLKLQEARVVDLIDEAIDIAMIDREFLDIIFHENLILKVDFNFFAIAIKNLIDNAITYSSDKRVLIEIYSDKIIFKNRGKELKKEFSEYLEAFTKENSKGFGLGLYIVANIIKLHKFKLNYEYSNGENIFTIVIK